MDLQKCPVCLRKYHLKECLPRRMSCGHTYCTSCLSRILAAKRLLQCLVCFRTHSPPVASAFHVPVDEEYMTSILQQEFAQGSEETTPAASVVGCCHGPVSEATLNYAKENDIRLFPFLCRRLRRNRKFLFRRNLMRSFPMHFGEDSLLQRSPMSSRRERLLMGKVHLISRQELGTLENLRLQFTPGVTTGMSPGMSCSFVGSSASGILFGQGSSLFTPAPGGRMTNNILLPPVEASLGILSDLIDSFNNLLKS